MDVLAPLEVDWLKTWTLRSDRKTFQAIRAFERDAGHPSGQESVRFGRLATAEQWEMLRQRAREELAARLASLGRLDSASRALGEAMYRGDEAVALAGRVGPVTDTPGWRAFEDSLRQQANSGTGHGGTHALSGRQLDEAIALLGKRPGALVRDMLSRSRETEDFGHAVARKHISSASHALLALAIARFNILYWKQLPTNPLATTDLVRQANSDLDDAVKAVWSALRSEDPLRARAAADRMGSMASRRLVGALATRMADNAQRRTGGSIGDPLLGQQGVALAETARRHLDAYAIGHDIRFAAGGTQGRHWQQWVRLAQRSARAGSAYRWPHLSRASTLAERPGRSDGKARSVEGRVLDVKGTRRRNKLVSTVTLDDGSATMTAFLPYIRLDSGGLAVGSWVRVAGVWQKSAADIAGVPGLAVDRRSLRSLGQTGWWDAARLNLNEVFVTVPHSVSVEWSWQPGPAGAASQLIYDTWRLD